MPGRLGRTSRRAMEDSASSAKVSATPSSLPPDLTTQTLAGCGRLAFATTSSTSNRRLRALRLWCPRRVGLFPHRLDSRSPGEVMKAILPSTLNREPALPGDSGDRQQHDRGQRR